MPGRMVVRCRQERPSRLHRTYLDAPRLLGNSHPVPARFALNYTRAAGFQPPRLHEFTEVDRYPRYPCNCHPRRERLGAEELARALWREDIELAQAGSFFLVIHLDAQRILTVEPGVPEDVLRRAAAASGGWCYPANPRKSARERLTRSMVA